MTSEETHKAAEKTPRQAEQEWSMPILGSQFKELDEAVKGVH